MRWPAHTTCCTVISLRVSVPVLSEQITVTEPSVSTAGSRRITACRCVMRCTPMASVIVMIAGSPSGIAATARPTAAMNTSPAGMPRTPVPNANSAAAAARITKVSVLPKPAILRSSGVVSCSTDSSILPMRPISVAAPVATTTARACPWVTSVPA